MRLRSFRLLAAGIAALAVTAFSGAAPAGAAGPLPTDQIATPPPIRRR
ncbi:hypothetical protein [Mycobacterium sp. DL592]|nr:hypothetical protein [Mycobacterium sp. DL592]